GSGDNFTDLGSAWDALPTPRHRVVFEDGAHWDYLSDTDVPCAGLRGPCRAQGPAVDDLVTMFFGRYLPSELASHDGVLHMIHLGDTSNTIYHSTWDGSNWDQHEIRNQKAKAACALASHQGLLHMVHLGDTSNTIY